MKNKVTSNIKVIKKDFSSFVGWQLEGNGRFLHSDFTVLHNTPEGDDKFKIIFLYLSFTGPSDIQKILLV